MDTTPFDGFGEDFFEFFKALKNNNNREWFNHNKDRYHAAVVRPMGQFITAIAPRLERISPHFVANPKAHGGSMFRIYRDTRFAQDKTPYKTHAACQFRHAAGRDAHAPGFYVHIETDHLRFGGGIWRPPAKQLGMIRDFIADNPAAWEKIVNSAAVRKMGGIQGDTLKRPPRGFDPDARHIGDLKRKSFYLMAEADPALALSPALVDEAIAAFRGAAGLNRFISDALEVPF